jgi:hypothetical protein
MPSLDPPSPGTSKNPFRTQNLVVASLHQELQTLRLQLHQSNRGHVPKSQAETTICPRVCAYATGMYDITVRPTRKEERNMEV